MQIFRDLSHRHGDGSTDKIVRLSDTKDHFTVKRGKNAFLTLKWPFVGQHENFICFFL
jgi:hypothetical protein